MICCRGVAMSVDAGLPAVRSYRSRLLRFVSLIITRSFVVSTTTPLKLGYGSTTIRTGGRSPPSMLLLFGMAICDCLVWLKPDATYEDTWAACEGTCPPSGGLSTPPGIMHIAPSVSSAACVAATNMSSMDGARRGVTRHTPAMNTHDVTIRRGTD